MDLEVVYIAYAGYGPEPVARFFRSYEKYPAGTPHRLTVAAKGHGAGDGLDALVRRCAQVDARVVEVPDGGLDIGTYLHMAARSTARVLCLLNSSSVILGESWLAKLFHARNRQGGGAVSATGSWESLSSDELGLAHGRGTGYVRTWMRYMRRCIDFPPFPNPHLRTNALLIEPADLFAPALAPPASKGDAWLFESGRRGLSATLRRRGLPLGVVGRDGSHYPADRWHRSGTFWQGEQANLLVGDNQTRRYRDGDEATRKQLSSLAWRAPSAR